MLVAFGIAFELPLVLLVLNLLGIVSAAQLASKRRHAIFIIFVAACCIVPSTDIFSLTLMSAPLYLLFEGSIFIARIFERRKAKPRARKKTLRHPERARRKVFFYRRVWPERVEGPSPSCRARPQRRAASSCDVTPAAFYGDTVSCLPHLLISHAGPSTRLGQTLR